MTQALLVSSALLVGAAGTGAVILSGAGLVADSEPRSRALREDTDFDRSLDYFNAGFLSFGRKYKWYMVGQSRLNRRWWNHSLHRISSPTGLFRRAEYGWWYEGDRALNRICRGAYVTYHGDIEGGKHTEYPEEDVWKYCSVLGRRPRSAASDSYDSTHMGGMSDLAPKLISVRDPENDLFWSIRNEEFRHELGRVAAVNKAQYPFFDILFTRGERSLREGCAEAYQLKPRDQKDDDAKDNPTREGVLRFCSLGES